VPSSPETVTETYLPFAVPAGEAHTRLVELTYAVVWHTVSPTVEVAETDCMPKLEPESVTLVSPDVAPFRLSACVTTGLSKVNADVWVPMRELMVSEMSRSDPTPWTPTVVTEVVDVQVTVERRVDPRTAVGV
jgi:hypothetical protein